MIIVSSRRYGFLLGFFICVVLGVVSVAVLAACGVFTSRTNGAMQANVLTRQQLSVLQVTDNPLISLTDESADLGALITDFGMTYKVAGTGPSPDVESYSAASQCPRGSAPQRVQSWDLSPRGKPTPGGPDISAVVSLANSHSGQSSDHYWVQTDPDFWSKHRLSPTSRWQYVCYPSAELRNTVKVYLDGGSPLPLVAFPIPDAETVPVGSQSAVYHQLFLHSYAWAVAHE